LLLIEWIKSLFRNAGQEFFGDASTIYPSLLGTKLIDERDLNGLLESITEPVKLLERAGENMFPLNIGMMPLKNVYACWPACLRVDIRRLSDGESPGVWVDKAPSSPLLVSEDKFSKDLYPGLEGNEEREVLEDFVTRGHSFHMSHASGSLLIFDHLQLTVISGSMVRMILSQVVHIVGTEIGDFVFIFILPVLGFIPTFFFCHDSWNKARHIDLRTHKPETFKEEFAAGAEGRVSDTTVCPIEDGITTYSLW